MTMLRFPRSLAAVILPIAAFSQGVTLAQAPAAAQSQPDPAAKPAYGMVLRSPVEHQIFQRADAKEGELLLEGDLVYSKGNPQRPQKLEGRVVGEGTTSPWQPVVFSPHVAAFRGVLKAPAGGWYRVEVRATEGARVGAEKAVEHVGVGEVFVVAGQSNSANWGEEKLGTTSGRVSARLEDGSWQVCQDPQPGAGGNGGSFLPPLGDALAAEFGVPVGFVSTGVGATSVREWLPKGVPFTFLPTLTGRVVTVGANSWESNGAIFGAFSEKLRALGKRGFRAVLWHQGESDANQADPTRTLPGYGYRTYLEKLITESRVAAGWEAPWFVAQASYHVPGDEFSPEIRLAQRQLWESGIALEGADTDALTGASRERGGKGVHLSGAGQREHAALWAQRITPWLREQLAGGPGQASGKSAPKPAVRLAPNGLFSDRMVLQQGRRVPVWGVAPAHREVRVEFAGQTKVTKADTHNQWRVELDPLQASFEPRTLVIADGFTRLELRDVLVGEVWLASGQSNMHWSFSHSILNGETELAEANEESVRQFTIRKGGAASQPVMVQGGWHRANRNELLSGGIMGDSALGYFFARELRRQLGVPVGILNASVGGTPIEAWSEGGGLYKTMVDPLAPYAIAGALWYQGESNCLKLAGAAYTGQLERMVAKWRSVWSQGEFPFFYVQIAPWTYSMRSTKDLPITRETLPEFWMAQTAFLKHPHTGMAVINDTVTDVKNIHPGNKQEVARRLAAMALSRVYRKDLGIVDSPLFEGLEPEGARIRVRFQHARNGLATRDGKSPTHLEVAGADGVFRPATGTIEGPDLWVQSPEVPAPKHVRYAWDEEAIPNLMNHEGFPVAPFHSEKWPLAKGGPGR
jgi:hypothetical protein